jgi:hypothetical protein
VVHKQPITVSAVLGSVPISNACNLRLEPRRTDKNLISAATTNNLTNKYPFYPAYSSKRRTNTASMVDLTAFPDQTFPLLSTSRELQPLSFDASVQDNFS